jgi:hypothetical protein
VGVSNPTVAKTYPSAPIGNEPPENQFFDISERPNVTAPPISHFTLAQQSSKMAASEKHNFPVLEYMGSY